MLDSHLLRPSGLTALLRVGNVRILHDCEWLQLVEALKYDMPLHKLHHKHSKITARMR